MRDSSLAENSWRWSAAELADAIKKRRLTVIQATLATLDRIEAVNPKLNALPEVMAEAALSEASEADRKLAYDKPLGPLHGVPVTVKMNVDTAGRATSDGVVALKDLIAEQDSPVVANLKRAGAIIVGRSNTPAFSLRWFTDNDLHGRTLNPFDPGVTPGGSSGGGAAAVASGMGAIAHGNDYGGSIRYPAWACGVVGLRPTVGRVPSFKATAKLERGITNQMMAVQGPLTRTVADARLALAAMSPGDARDPQWVPAPLEYPEDARPLRVALFRNHEAYDADPTITRALEQAAGWLAEAGCVVEEAAPPQFEETAAIWRRLVYDDLRRGAVPAIEAMGDEAVKINLRHSMEGQPEYDRDGYLEALARRLTLCRDWSLFLEKYDVLLLPNSWQRQFPVDADTHSPERMNAIIAAQSPQLAIAMLGLPGLSVPTGLDGGLPSGVQLVSRWFREDLSLRAGALIEAAAGFSALETLAPE